MELKLRFAVRLSPLLLVLVFLFGSSATCAHGDDPSTVPNFTAASTFPVPTMPAKRTDLKAFEYLDVGSNIPNYTPSKRWGVLGEAKSKMQKPLPAAESMKHLVVPEGFRVELFASEPAIGGKPICMAWDERGRLWIAESLDYPNELQEPGKGRDRIRILEDTTGDGRADKATIFAEKLSIPTSIAFSHGGIIVHQAPDTLFLKDTDGDDRADVRKVLFTGWGTGDTHAGPSNLNYGHDNWFYGILGYSGFRGTIVGQERSFSTGFYRFRVEQVKGEVEVTDFEFLRNTNNNSWGVGFNEEGILFGSTANRNPSVYMPIPNRYYERVRGWTASLRLGTIADTHLFKPITDRVRQVDQHGGYTAAAGHALYTARNYPQAYWNRTAFVNGPTGHLVGTFILKPDGSDFSSSNPFNMLASDDEWTAPIMSEVGPDGNLWVIDWYNFIIQHNPVPHGFKRGKGNAYETDLRDKKHGRIYRLVYAEGKAPTNQKTNLADATPEQLVATLKNPNLLWRRHAQRLLIERGKLDVLPTLVQLASDRSIDAIGLNVGAIHALWTMHELGTLEGSHAEAMEVVLAALRHPSAGVRRVAIQVLPSKPASTAALLAAGVLADSDAQVRLAAFLALSDLPTVPGSGAAILTAMRMPNNADDRWIPEAGTSAAAMHNSGFLIALAKSKTPPVDQELESARIVAEHYARGAPVDSVAKVMAGLIQAESSVADAIISGLAKGWPADAKPKMDEQFDADLKKVIVRLSPGGQGLLVKLASGWGSAQLESFGREVSATLMSELDDEKLSVAKRVAAASKLIEFQPLDKAVVALILERISPRTSPELALGMIEALRMSKSPEVGKLLIGRFRSLTPQTRAGGIIVLLSRPQSTKALLDAVDKGVLQFAELSLDQKQALAVHPDGGVRNLAKKLLERGGSLPNPDRQKVLAQLLPITKETGDPKNGMLVFKKQCAQCHVHSGEGNRIGPDLTGMAVHPKVELLTHIIDPSRNVEGNFRVYTVVTADGKILSGLLASESKTAIEIFDAEGKKKVVLREDVDELVASTKSLMPEGFEKQVTRQEISDLLEFLTQRGKFVPISLAKVATIASDRGMFSDKSSASERLIFPDWKPKTFQGVPFTVTDPQDGKVANVVLLHGPDRPISSRMPKQVRLACNGPAKAIHLLSGVGGGAYPATTKGSVSMIVRLQYADGKTEDHELKNGVHFADYVRRVDVPGSEFAFNLRGQQIRYLVIHPKRKESITHIDLVKGPDTTAPVVMAMTVESP